MVLGIYGAGGSGREVYDLIRSEEALRSRWTDIIFLDDTVPAGESYTLRRVPFADFARQYPPHEAEIIIAVGEPPARRMLAQRVREKGYRLASVISETAFISPSAVIAEGAFLGKGTFISSEAKIDRNVWLAPDVQIGHNSHIRENCQISASVRISSRTLIGENTFLGISACVREDTVVGHDAIISMGAIVLKDVRPNKIVIGNPAREVAENTAHRVFREKRDPEAETDN